MTRRSASSCPAHARWAGDDGVRLGYNDPRELADGYAVDAHRATLNAMSALLATLADAAGLDD